MVSFADVGQWARFETRTICEHVSRDLPDGYWVNLGIGMPTEVGEIPILDRDVVFQCENGVNGMGPRPAPGEEIPELINAAKRPVSLVAGGSYSSHCDSFAMIRGRHLDLSILGAFQVSFAGDLANWTRPSDPVPAVGGAMDLAAGAKDIWVMMRLFGPEGSCKLVPQCTYPFTAERVVSRVYTDVATFHLQPGGISVTDLADGVSIDMLRHAVRTELAVTRSGVDNC